MPRQNVGKPRFYIDLLQYWHAKGLVDGIGAYGHKYNSGTGEQDPQGNSQYWWGSRIKPDGVNAGFEMIGLANSSNPFASERYRSNSGALNFALQFKTRMYAPHGSDTKFYNAFFNHNFYNLKFDISGNIPSCSFYKTYQRHWFENYSSTWSASGSEYKALSPSQWVSTPKEIVNWAGADNYCISRKL